MITSIFWHFNIILATAHNWRNYYKIARWKKYTKLWEENVTKSHGKNFHKISGLKALKGHVEDPRRLRMSTPGTEVWGRCIKNWRRDDPRKSNKGMNLVFIATMGILWLLWQPWRYIGILWWRYENVSRSCRRIFNFFRQFYFKMQFLEFLFLTLRWVFSWQHWWMWSFLLGLSIYLK